MLLSFTLLGSVGCSLPQVKAEDRLFLPLSLEFLDEAVLAADDYEGTPVGGLSAIAYDRRQDRFYALSDDRGAIAPPRFYTLKFDLSAQESSSDSTASGVTSGTISDPEDNGNSVPISIDAIDIEAVTYLTQEEGRPFPVGSMDPEGLVITPERTLFISSEGDASADIPPSVDEFDLTTGQRLRRLPVPPQYIPERDRPDDDAAASSDPFAIQPLADAETDSQRPQVSGIQNNRGFEALALSAAGMGMNNDEPYRVFAGLEEPLLQDLGAVDAASEQPSRLLHYVVSPDQAFVLAEHVYPLDPLPFGAVATGLVELLSLDQGGHFLSLERSFGLGGVRAKVFQVVFSNASDTVNRPALPPDLATVQTMRKQLVLDLHDLGIPLDNLEGMTLGPRLPDGSKSLMLISDNNFNTAEQSNQVLLFRIRGL